MKMVKSLLLGTAAGFAAVVGAQAADLPGKAAPAQYVKICSAYGAQFYYIPGTDTCLRVGGYVRAEWYINNAAGGASIGTWTRNGTNLTSTRARAVIDLDARSNTALGTLRSYARFGETINSGAGAGSYLERAFIQLGGLTVGYVQSMFDYFTGWSINTMMGGSNRWTNIIAYTHQFGGGVSGTLSVEDGSRRRTGLDSVTVATLNGTGAYAGHAVPDVTGNVRIDGSWGSAQLSGALHQIRAANLAGMNGAGNTIADSSFGWAIGGGLTFNLPMLGAGDQFVIQANYADGATDYTINGGSPVAPAAALTVNKGGSILGAGMASGIFTVPVLDAVVSNGNTSTVKSWSLVGGLRHFWTPTLRTAFQVHYTAVDVPAPARFVVTPVAGANLGTGADFKVTEFMTNTFWSPVPNMDIGVELLYTKVDPAGARKFDTWGGTLRFQRNF